MLEITKQIKNEILKSGLIFDITIKDIEPYCNQFEKVNYIELRDNNDGSYCCWLINHDEQSNYYHYYTDKAIVIKAYKDSIKTRLLNNILCDIEKHKSDFLRTAKPTNGYYAEQLKDNKPATLLNAKNNNFVCFICLGVFDYMTIIDINQDKKELESNFFTFGNCKKPRDARKDAKLIFAIYNDGMTQHQKELATICEKQATRKANKINEQKRYLYNDADFNAWWNRYHNRVYLYGFSHNSLLKHEFDYLGCNYIYIDDERVGHNAKTRQELYNFLFDKNGFYIFDKKQSLKKRAEQLKKQRANEQKEKNHTEWLIADHTQQRKQIDTIMNVISKKIIFLLSIKALLNAADHFNMLDKLTTMYKRFSKLLLISRYADFNEWNTERLETMSEYAFYCVAYSKNKLNEIAPRHYYSKTKTGYVMNERGLTDRYWGNYYIKEF